MYYCSYPKTMSSTLEDLFGQILHSEQKAHERRTLINQVKNEVLRTRQKITEVQEEMTSVKGKLVLQLQQWNDAQLHLKSAGLRETVLRAQKGELLQEEYKLNRQLVDIRLKIDIARQEFCKSVDEFTTSYDLCCRGTHQREQQAKYELRKLRAEEEKLTAELSSHKTCMAEMETLRSTRDKLLAQLEETTAELTGEQSRLAAEEKLSSELEQEKIRLTELPYTDSEFKRLQAALASEASQNDDLEMRCNALQRQREELQQQLWQQQLQMKRKQQHRDQANYKRWQQLGQAETEEEGQSVPVKQELGKRQTRPNIGRLSQAVRASKTRKTSGGNTSSQS